LPLARNCGVEHPEAHVRRSLKSTIAKARFHKEEVDGGLQLSAEAEFSWSTKAVITLMVEWSSGLEGARSTDSQAKHAKHMKLMRILFDKFLCQKIHVKVDGCPAPLVLQHGKVDCAGALANTSLAKTKFGREAMPLPEALSKLRRSVKYGPFCSESKALCSKIFDQLVDTLVCRFELDVPLHMGHKMHGGLPILRLKEGPRPRRVSMGIKKDIVQVTGETSSLRTPSQLVSGQAALNKRKGLEKPVTPRGANRFIKQNMYQYWLGGREMWSDSLHVSMATDAGRVGDDDLLQQVYYNVKKRAGCWGPPQVRGR
jgi:hypothetical protein